MVCIMARALLRLCTITVDGNCVIRIRARRRTTCIINVDGAYDCTDPYDGLLLDLFTLPMACGCLSESTRANTSIARLSITIDELIRIRRIRISEVPERFYIMLDIRIRRELLRDLRTLSPRLD